MKRMLWILLLAAAIVLAVLVNNKSAEAPPAEVPEDPAEPIPLARETADDSAEWNTYHGDAGLTGFSSLALPETLRLAWTFHASAPLITTPVSSGQHIFFTDTRGTIYAITHAGALAWSHAPQVGTNEDGTPRAASFDAPLACFDGMLYACDAGGLVIALDAASGEERWRQPLGVPILGSPNYNVIAHPEGSRGVLYVIGQDNGALHALDAESGERLWVTEAINRCDGSPGVGENKVVFGSCDSALHIFASDSGALKHNVPIPGDSQVASGVAVFQGSAISGCRSGKLLRVRLDDGEVLWSVELVDDEIFGTPAVNGAHVVITAEDGHAHAADFETGAPLWKTYVGNKTRNAIITGDKVVVTADGSLHLLSLDDGTLLWRRELADELTGPAVAGRLIIVGADDGTVLAFAGDGV